MEKDRSVKFMFQAAAWRANELRPVILRQVFRQKDMGFVELLDQMRRAKLSNCAHGKACAHVHAGAIWRARAERAHASTLPTVWFW